MTDPIIQLADSLKKAGQSLTNPRKVVFEALQNQEPQTMHRLIEAVGDQIDRASVYRTIALYERLGIVQRLQIGWKYKLELSDDFHHHHHHLTCLKCGRVIALVEDNELESKLIRLADNHKFDMQGHQLEIRGLCAECRK